MAILCLSAGLLAILGVGPGGGDAGADLASPRLPPMARQLPPPGAAPIVVDEPGEHEPEAEIHGRHARQVADLAAACQLTASSRCDGPVCATLLVMPDLDAATGWASLLVESPAFVATVALRDVGVPVSRMPCVHVVDGLAREPVRAVELADGTEVWCTATERGPAANALCDALATERAGSSAARFGEVGLRELQLSP